MEVGSSFPCFMTPRQSGVAVLSRLSDYAMTVREIQRRSVSFTLCLILTHTSVDMQSFSRFNRPLILFHQIIPVLPTTLHVSLPYSPLIPHTQGMPAGAVSFSAITAALADARYANAANVADRFRVTVTNGAVSRFVTINDGVSGVFPSWLIWGAAENSTQTCCIFGSMLDFFIWFCLFYVYV